MRLSRENWRTPWACETPGLCVCLFLFVAGWVQDFDVVPWDLVICCFSYRYINKLLYQYLVNMSRICLRCWKEMGDVKWTYLRYLEEDIYLVLKMVMMICGFDCTEAWHLEENAVWSYELFPGVTVVPDEGTTLKHQCPRNETWDEHIIHGTTIVFCLLRRVFL